MWIDPLHQFRACCFCNLAALLCGTLRGRSPLLFQHGRNENDRGLHRRSWSNVATEHTISAASSSCPPWGDDSAPGARASDQFAPAPKYWSRGNHNSFFWSSITDEQGRFRTFAHCFVELAE